jgi:hypothetical protein
MELTREKAVEILIDVLVEAQQDMPDATKEINASTNPIKDLKDFDSLASVLATVHCFDALEFDMGNELPFISLFVKNNKALTVGEAADRITKFIRSQ